MLVPVARCVVRLGRRDKDRSLHWKDIDRTLPRGNVSARPHLIGQVVSDFVLKKDVQGGDGSWGRDYLRSRDFYSQSYIEFKHCRSEVYKLLPSLM